MPYFPNPNHQTLTTKPEPPNPPSQTLTDPPPYFFLALPPLSIFAAIRIRIRIRGEKSHHASSSSSSKQYKHVLVTRRIRVSPALLLILFSVPPF